MRETSSDLIMPGRPGEFKTGGSGFKTDGSSFYCPRQDAKFVIVVTLVRYLTYLVA
jgi:hypothetical protein